MILSHFLHVFIFIDIDLGIDLMLNGSCYRRLWHSKSCTIFFLNATLRKIGINITTCWMFLRLSTLRRLLRNLIEFINTNWFNSFGKLIYHNINILLIWFLIFLPVFYISCIILDCSLIFFTRLHLLSLLSNLIKLLFYGILILIHDVRPVRDQIFQAFRLSLFTILFVFSEPQ